MKPEFTRTGRIRDRVGRKRPKAMGIRHTRRVTSTIGQDHLASTEAAIDLWRTAVVYQINPRSFAHSNGDGIGDLPGITSRVPYLRSLAVDAVWLSPFYPSALADGGCDIDDHREVDPRLGSLADFDAMVSALHTANIKVIVDIVPNHTSNRHPWFIAALAAGRGAHGWTRHWGSGAPVPRS